MKYSHLQRSTQIAILDRTRPRGKSGTTPITLTDTVNGYIKTISVKGHSEKSKNLFNFADKTTTQSSYVIPHNTSLELLGSTDYVLSFDYSGASGSASFVISDEAQSLYQSADITLTTGTRITATFRFVGTSKYIRMYSSGVGTYSNFQIEVGSTATSYEPFGIKSIGDAGWGVVDLGTLNWFKAGDYSEFRVPLLSNMSSFDNSEIAPILCTKYNAISVNYAYQGLYTGIGIGANYIAVGDKKYTDLTAFKSAMSGVLLYYPLADATGATPTLGITSKDGAGQGTAATITTGLPLRSVSDTIYDVLDNDKVTKKCAEVDLGNLTWEIYSSADNIFYSDVLTGAISGACISSEYTYENVRPQDVTDKHYTLYTNNRLYLCDTDYTSGADLKTAVAGVKLVYPLSTPTETALSSAEKSALAALRTYSGGTTIAATDNPDISVTYSIIPDPITRSRTRRTTKKKS